MDRADRDRPGVRRSRRLASPLRLPAGPASLRSPGDFRSRIRIVAAALAVSAFLALTPGGAAWAQTAQTAVCSSTPGPGERVECQNADTNPIDIDLVGVDIVATDDDEPAVYLYKQSGGNAAIDLSIAGSSIGNTATNTDHLIFIRHDGSGDIGVVVRDSTITNLGEDFGIRVWTINPPTTGDIDILLENARLYSEGNDILQVQDVRSGDVRIRVRNSVFTGIGRNSRGIFADVGRGGAIDITVSGGSIRTEGNGASGIVALKSGTGGNASADPIRIAVDGVTITTTGGDDTSSAQQSRTTFGSHGIAAEHQGSGSVDVSVRGGSIVVSGANQHGIAVGGISRDGNTLYATSGRDDDGYRRQTVRVDGPVRGGSGTGAGVYLAGGGRVIIGPNGRVGAASGTAIRAAIRTGQATADDPKLHVDLRTGGRPIAHLLNGNIVNEGAASYTTIVFNGVVLIDGGTVVPGVRILNGARDVAVRPGADAANLSVADLERFAPRAAVYEALPGFLLRLDAPDGVGGEGRLRSPDSPIWVRLAGGQGFYRPENASVGARYSFDRYVLETGMDIPLDDDMTGWAGVRAVSGSARVSAATGGGRIEASGVGLLAGLSWEGEAGYYGTGRVSLTRYGVDFSSAGRGRLASGEAALVHALDLEAGRRFALEGETVVTPWVRLGSSGVSMDGLTDAVGSRIAVADADRHTLGVGADAEIKLDLDGAEEPLALRGSFGVESLLGGDTTTRVTREDLVSQAPKGIRTLLGVGAVWNAGPVALEGGVSANGLGSDDRNIMGFLTLRMAF